MTLGTFACILVHAPRRAGRWRTSTTLAGPRQDQPADGFRARRCCCSRWPAFRRSPASSPSSTCSAPPIKANLVIARRHRRAGERRRRLLLSAHRQGHVLRRARPSLPAGRARCRPFVMALSGALRAAVRHCPGAARQRALTAARALRAKTAPVPMTPSSRPARRRRNCPDLDEVDSTNAEAMRRAARRRAWPAVDHGRAPDRRARPLRPLLDVGARQPLRELRHALDCPPAKAASARRSSPASPRIDAIEQLREPFPACASNGRTTFWSAGEDGRHSGRKPRPCGRHAVAVIGVGLNLAAAPALEGRRATLLARHRIPLAARRVVLPGADHRCCDGSTSGTAATASRRCARRGSRAPAPSASR